MKFLKCVSYPEQFSKEEFERLGLGVEIQDFVLPTLLGEKWTERIEEYKKLLYGFDGLVSLHGTYLDLNPSSTDEDIVKITKKRYMQTFEVAKELGAKYIVFHSQINPWLKDPWVVRKRNENQYIFWREILEEVGDLNITILLENVFDSSPYELLKLMEGIDLPEIKVCLDVGHANLSKEYDLSKWLEILGSEIKYIHLHWNDGVFDEHNSPSCAQLEYFQSLLQEKNISPLIALEYHVKDLKQEVERIRNKVFIKRKEG